MIDAIVIFMLFIPFIIEMIHLKELNKASNKIVWILFCISFYIYFIERPFINIGVSESLFPQINYAFILIMFYLCIKSKEKYNKVFVLYFIIFSLLCILPYAYNSLTLSVYALKDFSIPFLWFFLFPYIYKNVGKERLAVFIRNYLIICAMYNLMFQFNIYVLSTDAKWIQVYALRKTPNFWVGSNYRFFGFYRFFQEFYGIIAVLTLVNFFIYKMDKKYASHYWISLISFIFCNIPVIERTNVGEVFLCIILYNIFQMFIVKKLKYSNVNIVIILTICLGMFLLVLNNNDYLSQRFYENTSIKRLLELKNISEAETIEERKDVQWKLTKSMIDRFPKGIGMGNLSYTGSELYVPTHNYYYALMLGFSTKVAYILMAYIFYMFFTLLRSFFKEKLSTNKKVYLLNIFFFSVHLVLAAFNMTLQGNWGRFIWFLLGSINIVLMNKEEGEAEID